MSIAAMLRRVGVFAFVVAASLGTAAHPQSAAKTQQNESAEIEKASARIADAIRQIRPEEDKGCNGPEDKPTSNLCAQWKAAEAARRAASATWAAVFFSFVGTFLVALTFWEQRKVSRAELRPYLFVQRVDVTQRGSRTFNVTVWLKNFGRTPARDIRLKILTYAAETIDDLRDFGPQDHLELSAAAPDHDRRALWHLGFTEEEWANPPWVCYGILRLAYTYTDDNGKLFSEAVDYYTSRSDLMAEAEPAFFLLTDWTRQQHAKVRAGEPDLFDAATIKGIRERNLAAEREKRERQQDGLREQMERLSKPAPAAKPKAKKKSRPGPEA